MSFVLHTHDKIEQLSLRHSCLCGFHTRLDIHVPLTLDYMICDPEQSLFFSLHNTRMKFRTRTRIPFGMKTLMNSFPNESHSGIMWIAPKWYSTSAGALENYRGPASTPGPPTIQLVARDWSALSCVEPCLNYMDICNTTDQHYTVHDWQDINFGLL